MQKYILAKLKVRVCQYHLHQLFVFINILFWQN